MNLLFGIIWLAAAAWCLYDEWLVGKPPLTLLGGRISAWWVFLLMAAFNFVRVYAARSGKLEQELKRRSQEGRLQHSRSSEEAREYNPEFDFTDPKTTNQAPSASNEVEK